MMDFYFFLKTFFFTLIVVLCLQIDIGEKTIETHIHDFMHGSFAAGFLGHAAHGGAHMVKDAAHKMAEKMKENIGIKHGNEPAEASETKASRFHWSWAKKKSAAAESEQKPDSE